MKSKVSWVYFQMYSPSITKYLPHAGETPARNSLRWPGLRGCLTTRATPGISVWKAAITGSLYGRA
jgi:hypothetical protein